MLFVRLRRSWYSPEGVYYPKGEVQVPDRYKPQPEEGIPEGDDPTNYLPSTAKVLGTVSGSVAFTPIEEEAEDWMEELDGVSVTSLDRGWFEITHEGKTSRVQGKTKAQEKAAELRK